MQVQTHPLEPFFQNAIRSSYEGRLGLGPDISSYVSRMVSTTGWMHSIERGRSNTILENRGRKLSHSALRKAKPST